MKNYAVAWATGLLGILFFSQSCAMRGSRIPDSNPEIQQPRFYMTGSERVYEYGQGRAFFSTEDLTDIYPDGIIDFMHSPDPKVRQLMEKIPFGKQFYILILNGQASARSLLQINETYQFAEDYSRKTEQFALGKLKTLPIYSFGPSAGPGARLDALKLHLFKDLKGQNNFATSALHCVITNTPGPKGEYRNGALTLQIVDASMTTFNEITKGAGRTARLLAEFTIHKEDPMAKCQ